jgi:hypothetical protein
MKATSKQINEAHSLLKAIAMILNIQNNQNIFGEGLEILYSALQEVEVDNETYESNTCLLRDGCDGLMCYNCIKKQKEDESKTNI